MEKELNMTQRNCSLNANMWAQGNLKKMAEPILLLSLVSFYLVKKLLRRSSENILNYQEDNFEVQQNLPKVYTVPPEISSGGRTCIKPINKWYMCTYTCKYIYLTSRVHNQKHLEAMGTGFCDTFLPKSQSHGTPSRPHLIRKQTGLKREETKTRKQNNSVYLSSSTEHYYPQHQAQHPWLNG